MCTALRGDSRTVKAVIKNVNKIFYIVQYINKLLEHELYKLKTIADIIYHRYKQPQMKLHVAICPYLMDKR